MRLPDLDWPSDLFTDVAAPIPEAIVIPYAAVAAKPNLWTEMVNSWIESVVAPAPRWNTPVFEASHSA